MKANLIEESHGEKALRLLEYVVSEWNSDPNSVICFDLRLVKEAQDLINEVRKKERMFDDILEVSRKYRNYPY